MKPLSLSIAGLNSFRQEQVINFDGLLEDGLFGIFGPTGSGKSSILDAITLALYGRVKRAPGGKGGIINVREKTCSVQFTFEIDTVDSRRTYRIDRVLGRPSGKTVGKSDGVVTKRARLIEFVDGTEQPIAEKQSEIDGQILELLGIEYDEFMRAVVLPQGAFADFLGLKPKDRAGVLQRLFGLQELGIRLAGRLASQAGDVRRLRDGMEGQLAQLRFADDDAVKEAERRHDGARAEEQHARAARSASATVLESAESLWSMLTERASLRAQEEYRHAVEIALTADRLRLDRSERATAISARVDELRRAEVRFQESEKDLETATADLRGAESRLAAARDRFTLADHAYKTDHDRLCDEIAGLDDAARELAAIAQLEDDAASNERELVVLRRELDAGETSRAGLRERIASATDVITANEVLLEGVTVSREDHDRLSRLQVVIERLRLREVELTDRQAAIDAVEHEIAELSGALDVAQEQERTAGAELLEASNRLRLCRTEVESLESDRSKGADRVREIEGLCKLVDQLESQRDDLEAAGTRYRATVDAKDAELIELQTSVDGHRQRQDALAIERDRASEQLQAAYRSNAIAMLVPQLRDGEACPLCGSCEHPLSAHPDESASTQITLLEEGIRKLDEKVNVVRRAIDECLRGIESNRTTRTMAFESLQTSVATLAAHRAKIDATVAAAGSSTAVAGAVDLRRYVAEISASEGDLRKRLETAKSQRSELEQHIAILETSAMKLRVRCAELDAGSRSKSKQQLDARGAVADIEPEVATLRSEIASESGGRTPDEIERDLETMRRNDRAAEQLREVIVREQRAIETVRRELDVLDRSIDEQTRKHTVAASFVERNALEINKRRAAIDDVVSVLRGDDDADTPIDRMIAGRVALRDRIARDRAEAEAQLNEAVNEGKLLSQDVEHRCALRARDRDDRDRLDRDCSAALVAAGFASEDEARAARLEVETQKALRAATAATEEKLRTDAARLLEVERLVGGRELTEAELADLRQAAADASDRHDATIAAAGAALNDFERLCERNAEFHRFSGENAEALARERTIEQLGRYLHGDAFINFLADERLSDVCRRATRTLEELTGGRYEIFSRPDEGFLVRDMGNGGFERAPGSLSGGETFIVSLSLALALSDTIQLGRAPLEFFFLDEGFGSLDAELLDTVVDTLERLRSGRRTIGLITHVASLRERVPRRLIVVPPDDGTGTIVRYEVA